MCRRRCCGTKTLLWYAVSIATFDLSSLADQLLQLDAGLREAETSWLSSLCRDGVAARFQRTYRLAVVVMQDAVSSDRRQWQSALFADAYEQGLISSSDSWLAFRDAHERLVTATGPEAADDVYPLIKQFLAQAREFLTRLQERGASSERK